MRLRRYFLLSLLFLSILACHSEKQEAKKIAPLFDVGSFHHPIQTQSKLAQRYFDQGLALFYSFEYSEALRSFQGAVKADPECSMCYWGIALTARFTRTVIGSVGYQAAQDAMKYARNNDSEERQYASAVTNMYWRTPSKNLEIFAGICGIGRAGFRMEGSLMRNYALAMRDLSWMYPNDPDAKVLYVRALFDFTSWNFWDIKKNPGSPFTQIMQDDLEAVLKTNPNHPGANHLYVHLLEFSPYRDKAIASAVRLHQLVPVSEHMAHMPCHTQYSLGDYHAGVLSNKLAIATFKQYQKTSLAQGFEPLPEYLSLHNYDYLRIVASMEGNKALSISAANDLARLALPWVESNPIMHVSAAPAMLMLARFGDWDSVIKIPNPGPTDHYVLSVWYYVKGLAALAKGHLDEANQDLVSLQAILNQGTDLRSNMFMNNVAVGHMAADTLEGLIAYKKGDTKKATEKLQSAVKTQDAFDYLVDPPVWYFPIRELYAFVLLKTNQAFEAEEVYEADLAQHPKNPWSLFGLAKAEHALRQEDAAKATEQAYREAWKYADIREPVYPIS